MSAISYRRFETDDRLAVYSVFRSSLWSYLADIGLVDPDQENDTHVAWERQGKLMVHTEETAAEDWVAFDGQEPVGWARSVERDSHLQLTHFFVLAKSQGKGVGRGLLDRAIPLGMGEHRSIMATMNRSALSLYLRYGVRFQGLSFTFAGAPQRRSVDHGLEIRRVEPASEEVEAINRIDAEILGYRRPVDIDFFAGDRPGFVFYREGEPVGYAFGTDGHAAGPAATLDPVDFPAVLQQVEATAVEAGQEKLWLTFPASASSGVSWALESGYRIDPFHEVLLADTGRIKLDRFLMTQPSFIW